MEPVSGTSSEAVAKPIVAIADVRNCLITDETIVVEVVVI